MSQSSAAAPGLSHRRHRSGTLLQVFGVVIALLAGLAIVTTPTAPASAATGTLSILEDFEGGIPTTYFNYNGGGAGLGYGAETIADTDGLARPDQTGDNNILSVGFDMSGGGFAGFGDNFTSVGSQDWSAFEGFSFWFYGNGDNATYQVEIFDGGTSDANAERWDYDMTDTTAGWQLIEIPFTDFTRATDFQPGGEPNDGLNLTTMWGYVFPFVTGTNTVKFDDIALYINPVESILEDFEGGIPTTYFNYNGGGAGLGYGAETIADTDGLARPDQTGDNNILSVGFDMSGGGFAGFGDNFTSVGSQDWSAFEGFSFWFYGNGDNATYQVEIFDGGTSDANAERWDYDMTDTTAGWQLIEIPFTDFTRATDFQPGGEPNDGLNLTTMWGYVFPFVTGTNTVKFDDIALYSNGLITPTASFASADFNVEEGDVATIEVTLNVAPTSTVTVQYATSDGGADSADYTSASGTLTFVAGDTSETFPVTTSEDPDVEPNETVTLTLSNPSGVNLGTEATLTILNDDIGTVSPTFDKRVIVDDFESGLPTGTDGDGIPIGFDLFKDDGSTVAITTAAPPSAVPGEAAANDVLQLDLNVAAFAGTAHVFENAAADTWVTQDWSRYEGISFWFYGNNSGTALFVDLLDNRNSGSTSDDAERFVYNFTDDTLGWKYVKIPFTDFARKEIGNGAPNDGLGLAKMHGWAIGSITTASPQTFYVDDVAVFERQVVIDDFESGLPTGTDGDGIPVGFLTFVGATSIAISTTGTPPAPAPGAPGANNVLQVDSNVADFAGFAHNFENAAADTWVPQDWGSFEGICFWMYGAGDGAPLFFDIIENRNPGSTVDDAERWSVSFTDDTAGWQLVQFPFSAFSRKDIIPGAPDDGFTRDEVYGYAFGSGNSGGAQTQYLDDVMIYGNNLSDLPLEVRFATSGFETTEGDIGVATVVLNRPSDAQVTVEVATSPSTDRQETGDLIATPDRDYVPAATTLVFAPGETEKQFSVTTIEDLKWEVRETVLLTLADPVGADLASLLTRANLRIVDDDVRDTSLLDDFETFPWKFETDGAVSMAITEVTDSEPMALPGQSTWENVLMTSGTGSLTREFELPVDWSGNDGVSVWVFGTDSGESVGVELLDNRLPDGGPTEWSLVWSDEFDAAAGTPADPANWEYETGGWGWGNDELQYYTDSTDNAAHDGAGNLVITVDELADPAAAGLPCWYGDCTLTSARLISESRQEFAYGRIEARAKVPPGTGIWPAVWTLGDDFRDIGWPQTGEIDIMEFVGRIPNEIFGTIHGPGYSGGQAYGNIYDFGVPVYDEYHTFTIEWQPNEITWYVDGIEYHSATPADVAPNEWVYEHAFSLLLNVAVGGNFGGAVGPDLTFPAELALDYIRVYQNPDTSERFAATFVDDFSGWQQVEIPWSAFTRSADQPAGAPNDGLTLTEVWGYGLHVTADGPNKFDHVRTESVIVPAVTTTTVPISGTIPPTGAPAAGQTAWLALLALMAGLGLVAVGQVRRRPLAGGRPNPPRTG